MIGYVTLGTNNFSQAAVFYDALLAELGAKRFMEDDSFIAWAVTPGAPGLAIIKPFDKKAATAGNGTMTALTMATSADVDRLYNKAIELGATCEGPPGTRGNGFYAAYFRDLDGNKLNCFAMT